MGKYKYKFGNGLAFFEEKDIKMCEDFASNGYKFVSINSFGFYKFERSQPEEVSFAVDYTEKSLKNEELAEYIEIFESGGWNHVYSSEQYHYFKAKRGTVPIYTDDVTKLHKFKMLYKISIQCTIIGIAIMAVAAILSMVMPAYSLYFNIYRQLLAGVFGIGLGLAGTMGIAIIINSRRIANLKKRSSLS